MVESESEEDWPLCEVEGCTNTVNPKRILLIGRCRCLTHGDPPKQFTVAPPYNKGALQLITHGDIEDIGK
jgi:hypothetical protein